MLGRTLFKIKSKFLIFSFMVGIFIIIFHSLWPFLWEVITSLKASKEVFCIPPTYIPHELSFESYREVFTQRPFLRYIINSTIIASGTTLLCITISALAGYGLARLKPRGGEIQMRLILVVALFPPIILVIPLYEVIYLFGLMNNPIALIVPYTAINLPFGVWVLTSFFRQIPKEIEDAAKVDGFSRGKILTKIILPLSAPALATTSILIFIFAWNEFLFALTFMRQEIARTVPVGIAMLSGVSAYEIPWGQISAAIVTTTLPLVLVVLALQRRIIHGLTAGAVKG
jgi:multiple sugar transport system permease protein